MICLNSKLITQLEKTLDQCEYLFGQQVTIDFYDRIAHYDLLLTENPHLGPCEPNKLKQGLRNYL